MKLLWIVPNKTSNIVASRSLLELQTFSKVMSFYIDCFRNNSNNLL